MTIADIDTLKSMMREAGADTIYVKRMAPNDNSKNQVYLGGDFSVLNILPYGDVYSEALGKRPNFKAAVNFSWLLDDGSLSHAKYGQLILYPDYPEVRFSGFLKGCKNAPSESMRGREEGRLLFLGVTNDGRILGSVADSGTALANSFNNLENLIETGVFNVINLDIIQQDTRSLLLTELQRIYHKGWITSKKLIGPNEYGPCTAPNCGGMTLEAELGIMPNSYSDPDFHGWEIKQHGVTRLDRPNSGVLTLMTPEPTAGFYREQGVEAFVRRYGYEDRMGREDRLNFGGVHKVGERHHLTNLTMTLDGFNAETGKIERPDGGVVLYDDNGNNAAEWKFSHMIEHWKHKHAKAAYIPSNKNTPPLQYRYGNLIRLGVGTDPLRLLDAMQCKSVYYDPGIKLENASTRKPKTKRRSQFRVSIKNIESLYHQMEQVNITGQEI